MSTPAIELHGAKPPNHEPQIAPDELIARHCGRTHRLKHWREIGAVRR